jgi:hypothetical protein
MENERTVVITVDKYARLLRDRALLRALENGGVDNWEWYSESLKDAGYYDEIEDGKFLRDAIEMSDRQREEIL